MNLKDLDVYNLANEISDEAWEIYQQLNWEDKKVMGYQFISAIDSVAANIAEGFGRYHYLDRNKFNYNARGSLLESIHWTEKLFQRSKISKEKFDVLSGKLFRLNIKLNNFIKATKEIKIKENNK